METTLTFTITPATTAVTPKAILEHSFTPSQHLAHQNNNNSDNKHTTTTEYSSKTKTDISVGLMGLN